MDTIKSLDAAIIDLIEDEEELTAEIERADTYKEEVYGSILRAERYLKATPTAGSGPHPPTATAETASRGTPTSKMKLPKLQLRSFNGELTRWTPFWESFEAAVHGNPELSEVEKFNYLTSLLEKMAKEAIAGLALTAANYRQAIDTLKKRFGCKHLIVNKHMDALLHVEAVASQSTKALRKLLDTVNAHIHSLQTIGVAQATYSNLLCPVLVGKLPSELQLIISRKIPESNWKLDTLLTAIEDEVAARERIGANPTQPTPNKKKEYPPSSSSLLSGSSVPCCYCNKSHSPSNCDAVAQVDARRQVLRRNGRCFTCLRKGHMSRDCRSKVRCQKCGGRHHLSICGSRPERDPEQQASAQPLVTQHLLKLIVTLKPLVTQHLALLSQH